MIVANFRGMGIPTIFAYSPQLYELQTWGAAGDGGFHLDNHTGAANLLSYKLAHIHGGTGSHAAVPESPAGSGGKGRKYSKSTSQDGNGTDDKSVAGSDDEAPGDDEHQAGESSNSASSSSNVEEAERSGGEVERSTSQGSQSSLELNGETQSMQLHHRERQGKTQLQKQPRQELLAPSCPQTLTARSLKQNGSVSDARLPGIQTNTLVCGAIACSVKVVLVGRSMTRCTVNMGNPSRRSTLGLYEATWGLQS